MKTLRNRILRARARAEQRMNWPGDGDTMRWVEWGNTELRVHEDGGSAWSIALPDAALAPRGAELHERDLGLLEDSEAEE